jgi:hypothetical protein
MHQNVMDLQHCPTDYILHSRVADPSSFPADLDLDFLNDLDPDSEVHSVTCFKKMM